MDAAGLVAANGPDPRTIAAELDLARQAIHDLRNPVGAVRLAVQMLRSRLGPLLTAEDGRCPAGVTGILDALEASTQQLCHLVGPRPKAATPPAAVSETPAPASSKPAPTADIDDLLRRLEILTVTRSSIPALLAIDAEPGLTAAVAGPELLRALSNLVENALEASDKAAPRATHTIDIAVRTEPADVLGDATNIVFEVRDRGVGLPASVQRWLKATLDSTGGCPSAKDDSGTHGLGLRGVRRVVEEVGGWVEAHAADPGTRIRIRVPAAP